MIQLDLKVFHTYNLFKLYIGLHNGLFAKIFKILFELLSSNYTDMLAFSDAFVLEFSNNNQIFKSKISSIHTISDNSKVLIFSQVCKLLSQVLQNSSIRSTLHDDGVTDCFLKCINKVHSFLLYLYIF